MNIQLIEEIHYKSYKKNKIYLESDYKKLKKYYVCSIILKFYELYIVPDFHEDSHYYTIKTPKMYIQIYELQIKYFTTGQTYC
jgi:hypothetical protein